MRKKFILFAIRLVLWRLALVWGKTLKITALNNEQFDALKQSEKNYIVAFWHGSMFVGWFVHRSEKKGAISALVSQSNDGEFLSTILERWGYTMIRGSSHIGGKEAMQLMVHEVIKGNALAITPDGPRGPRHEMKMGAVRVAQKTDVPLVLAGIGVKKKRHLRSWDKFEVPMPFSTIVVKYSDPVFVSKDLEGESLDTFKLEMQNKLNALTEEAEAIVGETGGRA
ncbi:MAG: lysophospholipid acyltransferase family protein [Bacteroidota bacterium]